jgi:hypothetical protein
VQAGEIGPDCSSCFGGIYSVDGVLQSTNDAADTETWRVTYSLDLSGYTGTSTHFVRSLAAQVVSASSFVSASNVFAPTSGTWTMGSGNVSNVTSSSNGCSGNTSNGWVCLAYSSGDRLVVDTETVYSWVFDVTVREGSWRDLVNIQANFDPPTGRFMSETVRVPEGAAGELPILLSGVVFLLLWSKRAWVRRIIN